MYHFQTMKQELWITLVIYMAYCIDKQRQKSRIRHKMSKLTVLRAAFLLIPQGVLINREIKKHFWDEIAAKALPMGIDSTDDETCVRFFNGAM